ncbi:apolipoprotein N-acyltransferase [Polyangium aurulentum]|uniref:apolipoprotein N-acyltransferase n=1 Tax=Polyangium aurulentum TaxID=2567896 RepID=UPI0010ADC29E|nr:apolipoprotein N-acyltransferase [Polyangium aurulentum]UQA59683.1 apolipoprotein N-acyltransferase [Polyangium aurulentum]
MQRLRRHQGLLLAVIGGVLFALTSPPTDLYPAVFLGLALLAATIADAPSGPRAFGRGIAWATAAGIVGLRFVPAVIQRFTPLGSAASYLALVLLAAGQSLIWAIGAAVAHAIHRRTRAPFELAFAAGVLVTVLLPSVFAWTPAGLVSPWPALVQLADIIGERGVSVIFAVVAALLARAGRAALHRAPDERLRLRLDRTVLAPLASALGIVAALLVHGALRIRSLTGDAGTGSLRVALINQAVGPLDRWDAKNHPIILRKLREMTRDAEAQGVDLTVWPEAAYPYVLEHGAAKAPRGPRAILGDGVRGPLLFGLITLDKPRSIGFGGFERNSFNSATLLLPDGSLSPSYDKLELLWFGETVPLGGYLPWLRRMFQKSGGLVPGDAPRSLDLPREGAPPVRMGVLNCYEDTLPGVGRLITRELRPNLLVNVTNDAWFVGTAEPELHARLGAMRAIEHRLDLVRSVNLGVASWIDARGVVRARDDSQAPSTLIATPTLRDGSLTVYGRLGDGPLSALLVAGVVFFARRARRAAAATDPEVGSEPDAAAGSPGDVEAGEGSTPPRRPSGP